MSAKEPRVLLLAVGATTGALAACILAHKLWSRQHDPYSLQVFSSSTWIPQALLQGGGAFTPATQAQLQVAPVAYDYAQSIEEVLVEARLPAHIQQQDINVKFGPSSLLVMVEQQCVIDGCLAGRILPQHSSWKIEGQGNARKLSVTLCKQPAASGQKYAVWSSLLVPTGGVSDAQKSPEKRDQASRAAD